jgi:putative hydrolase of the HAD superfamily
MSVKVIFFDAVGTLFYLPKGVGVHYSEGARRHGCEIPAEAMQAAFSAVYRAMPPRPASRAARPDDDKGWWRELVDRVLDRCHAEEGGKDGKGALDRDAYFQDVYAEFSQPGVWQLFPETLETLDALAPHFALGIISNFDSRLRAILGHLGIADRFQHLVISSEVGADKPDPWIFHRALALAEVSADEVLYAGDDPMRDWQGGEALGWRTFRLERPGNSLRDVLVGLGGMTKPE